MIQQLYTNHIEEHHSYLVHIYHQTATPVLSNTPGFLYPSFTITLQTSVTHSLPASRDAFSISAATPDGTVDLPNFDLAIVAATSNVDIYSHIDRAWFQHLSLLLSAPIISIICSQYVPV